MKRLIDAYALVNDLDILISNAVITNDKICYGDIRDIISIQKTVICVSDDFPGCPKEIRCEDILCGGACCEKP